MHFGFSYIGLIFLLMLFIPNFFWTKNKPKDYDEYAKCENKVLLILERIGEVAVSCLILIFSDFNPQGLSIWLLWLFASFGCMILYELYWIRYFRSEKTMKDFYSSYLGIPVAGATYNGPRNLDHGIEKMREHGIMRITKGRSANYVIQNVHVGIQSKGSHRGSPRGEKSK